ncbi:hypothetical protein V502_08818 [Pseudogymnoascus sp. VKM F-4520 (FW-2644)]|nr:hypothetical protein V502_08818 [Pseudogymnoascus sp. VKM F-4520 (FW-2644)]
MADLEKLGEMLTTEGPHKNPYFYIPKSAFINAVLEKVDPTTEKCYWLAKLSAGGKSTDRVLAFDHSSALEDLVRIEFSALDAWFVEDEKLLGGHPKDPYKRIECISSTREIRIEIDGVVVAKSAQNVFLYETLLRPRYYLPSTAVNWEVLSESETTTFCPYKGMANYYNLTIKGTEIKDAVWYYQYPTGEAALVAGRLCFYNEKMDVFVNGVKEEK